MVTLNLPFPPSVNHAWGQNGSRKYLKKSGHEFRQKVSEAVQDAGARVEGRLAVFITLHAPTRREYDIDNRIKAVLDALQCAGIFDDDEQVDVLWVMRDKIEKGGRCNVVIVPADSFVETYREIKNESI